MKKNLRIIAILLACVLSLALVFPTFATEPTEQNEAEFTAELAMVKGGANGIITFTMDDGYKVEAEALGEICKKYGAKGTLMLMGQNVDTPDELAYWNRLINETYK